MRFTLSEDIIKFLVMSLIPAGSKVTFDRFLDLLYDHFEMVISPVHYERAVAENKMISQGNAAFLIANQSAFAMKLKNCGLLRDLSVHHRHPRSVHRTFSYILWEDRVSFPENVSQRREFCL